MGRLRWWLWAVLLPSVALAQPALYPGTSTSGFVAGQGTATAITKWTNKTTITAGSLADTATQANKSVCFADGSPPLPVLNCGDAGIKYTKGSTPTLNLGVNGQYQVNGITVLGSSSVSLFEATAPSGVPNYDILYADSSAHRLKMLNNNGSAVQVVASGVDINTSDQVTALHLAGVTTNRLLKASSGNAVNSSVSDDGTIVNMTEPLDLTAQAAPALSAAAHSKFYFDSGANRTKLSENAGAYANILTASSTDTLTNKTYDSAGTGNVFKLNGTSITSISGNTAKVATVSGSLTTATDQVAIDASGNLVEVAEAVRTFVDNGTTGALAATSGTQYFAVVGQGLDTTESNVTEITPAVTVTGIGCGSTTAVPGGGKSWAFTLRNGKTAADCSLTCTISDTNNSCFANGSCVFANGDAFDWKVIPAGTPTASALSCFIQGVRTN